MGNGRYGKLLEDTQKTTIYRHVSYSSRRINNIYELYAYRFFVISLDLESSYEILRNTYNL